MCVDGQVTKSSLVISSVTREKLRLTGTKPLIYSAIFSPNSFLKFTHRHVTAQNTSGTHNVTLVHTVKFPRKGVGCALNNAASEDWFPPRVLEIFF